MLRGAGDSLRFPYLRKFIGFLVFGYWLLVSGFKSFLVSKFQSFLVWTFRSFKVSRFQSFNDPILPCYQISISWFLIGIDPISKISNIWLDGSSGWFGARRFGNFNLVERQHFEIYKNSIFQMIWNFLESLRYAPVYKDKNNWFGRPRTHPKVPKS